MNKLAKLPFFIGIALAAISVISCSQLKKLNPLRHCSENRAAIKISPKYLHFIRAKVNSCDGKLISILEKSERKSGLTPFLKDKYASASFHGSPALMTFIREKIIEMKRRSTDIKISASSEFAKNQYTKLIIKTIEQAIVKEVTILSKIEEAESYYLAYKAASKIDSQLQAFWFLDDQKNIIVAQDGRSLVSYYSDLGANSMRKRIISWKGGRVSSPYPIGAHFAKKTIQESSNHAKEHIETELKVLLKSQKITGVNHYHFLMSQFAGSEGNPYSKYELEAVAKKRITDSDGHQFADNDIAGLLLILGHMRTLEIETILPLRIEEESGVLFHSSLW